MLALKTAILNNPSLSSLSLMLEGGALPALVTGLSAVHRASLASALTESDRPLFIICPDETACDSIAMDLRSLTGEEPLIIPGREYSFYTAASVSRETEHKRLAALFSLAEGKNKICLCAVSGLLQRAPEREALLSMGLTISSTQEISPEKLEMRLISAGYSRTESVEGIGQFSRRGGIVDFYSPGCSAPVRVEFWGDEVDSISFFDLDSQRRTDRIESVQIIPARETLSSLYPGGKDALADYLEKFAGKITGKSTKFNGNKLIDNLKEDADLLRGGSELSAADRYMALIYPDFTTVLDYIPEDALVFMDQPLKTSERADGFIKQFTEDIKSLVQGGYLAGQLSTLFMTWEECCERLEDKPVIMADSFTVGKYPMEPKSAVNLVCKQLPGYGGSVDTAISDVEHYTKNGYSVVVLAGDERKAQLLCENFAERGLFISMDTELKKLPEKGKCVVSVGALSAGIEYPEAKLAVITDAQIGRSNSQKKKKRRKALSSKGRLTSYSDLSVGDLVVHEHHGIGRFAGIVKMPVDGIEKDYIKICFAGTDSLYVPAMQLDLVSKYIGAGEEKPVRLSKMGGTDWTRTKTRAKAAAKDMADGLIKLYAERMRRPGYAFSPDSPWQTEFEERFEYAETDDQLRCIAEIKKDMESTVPMDRLLCGDVGYGKTEVALRAVMKCVLDGKQAAILVPTTVLAQQHYQTALQRFFGFPVNISVLSRFRTTAQLKQTIKDIRTGAVDIVIGTHKLLQKDIKFKDLGLLIVDEEQRFGVSHKEHIKEISRNVDVLTLSATPIPRTMNMALSGLRDMSTIEEPPQERLPVQTFVMEHDWGVVTDAIRRELQRGGQVYYLHNRIESIERTASRLASMLDDAVIGVAHGKLDEASLSRVMEEMIEGEIQVLVCTTIIETGIDIPNVNTLIIEDADRMGLAQLHQIRGRVGRSSRRASAYLTFRKNSVLTEVAEKRLEAIREFAEFNSGFRIAMRDLEIRGAGNLLGSEQSGYLTDVGYDMYLKLLEEAVLEQRGEKPVMRAECSADLAVSANIPEKYVSSPEQRMDLYRRIALIRTEEEADDLLDEIIDRFGDPPSEVSSLVNVALLRGEAAEAGITDISQKSGFLRFELRDFDMQAVSDLYNKDQYKGKFKVEASAKPCLSLKLQSKSRIIDQARNFVEAYAASCQKTKEQKSKTEA